MISCMACSSVRCQDKRLCLMLRHAALFDNAQRLVRPGCQLTAYLLQLLISLHVSAVLNLLPHDLQLICCCCQLLAQYACLNITSQQLLLELVSCSSTGRQLRPKLLQGVTNTKAAAAAA